ncbi:MAG: ATP-binding cassette domain-containing protein, partial [Rhizobiales bacterium]|nr:ATP-binding cassette domain-containing protein [Hyphomicrobiales bacterium]
MSTALDTRTEAKPHRAVGLETIGMTKVFGPLVALDDVSIRVAPGTVHALLGENGAGKSTLVKCIMGFYEPTRGSVLVDGAEAAIRSPRDAHAHGIGMVYQQFTLVPSLTAAENLVISRAHPPPVIDWRKEKRALADFLDRMPFKVPLDKPVSSLAAGEKQKLEILKQLYLDQRFLILDEPTSVLTPGEADEVLGLLRDMTARGELTILMITHKFREVTAFTDEVTVLRHGKRVGGGLVKDLGVDEMSRMMIGETQIRERAARKPLAADAKAVVELAGIFADDDRGLPAVEAVNLKVHAGEIVGIAGISGNGQSQLVEVLSGQRAPRLGQIIINGRDFEPVREQMDRFKVFSLQEEPLRNAAVPRMTVAENISFRTFDKPPITSLGWWLSPGPMRARARELIAAYRVKTPSTMPSSDCMVFSISSERCTRPTESERSASWRSSSVETRFDWAAASRSEACDRIFEWSSKRPTMPPICDSVPDEMSDRRSTLPSSRRDVVDTMSEARSAEVEKRSAVLIRRPSMAPSVWLAASTMPAIAPLLSERRAIRLSTLAARPLSISRIVPAASSVRLVMAASVSAVRAEIALMSA